MSGSELQSEGMLSKEQLIHFFKRFSYLTSLPDVKKRIADDVRDHQEGDTVTTAIQGEILLEMGVDPRFGIAYLGKINTVYENDRDLIIKFYEFVAKEEMVCDEAELDPNELAAKIQIQQKIHGQQLEMLKHMRKFHPDDQSAILDMLHQQMENAKFDNTAGVLTSEQIQEIVRRRISSFTNTLVQ
ncbi:hypothetical protein GIB67_009355 [Kingdonia uniflora]|uniref:Uncharacterized protein n=1 Tax=Kingdonia uniflora TaxID=39325 RepID=A0A7J7N2Y8_9MAGN|nr:hypothetical protein GIB67_009355 [Kingdonia uniflora]